MTGAKTAIPKKPPKETGYIGTFILSRYYSPQSGQDSYYEGSLRADVKRNCGIDPKLKNIEDGCIYAKGGKLDNSMIAKVGACPTRMFGKKIQIDMGFGKQEFKCIDVGGAIKGKKIDIRCGFGQEGLNGLKFGLCKNTGKAKVFIF